ncbi:MAG TPA: MFS transporter [Kiloniellaceae bacterium]|nr:MFS transporter [Kiloniellaceae bacterium]
MTAESGDKTARASGRERRLLAVLWLGMFLVSFDFAALAIALPSISADLKAGLSAASWVSLAYLLSMASLMLPAGYLVGRLGVGLMVTAGFSIFALASLGCAFARDIYLLSALRLLQGAGAAALYVSGPAAIRGRLSAALQDRAFALYSTAGAAGLCFGPAIGGFVTAHLGWPWIFLLNLPVAAVGLLLLGRGGHQKDGTAQSAGPAAPFDVAGAMLSFFLLLGIVFSLNQGRELGWGSPPILAAFGFAGLVAVSLLLWELRTAAPAFDLRLFRAPAFGFGNLGIFWFLQVTGGFLFLLPFALQWYRGMSPDQAGLLYLVHPLAMILASLLLARLATPAWARQFQIGGVLLMAGALALLAFSDHGTPLWVLVPALAAVGFGYGSYFPATQSQIMNGVPTAKSGQGAAANAVVRVMAQLLGIVLFETIFSQRYILPSAPSYGSTATPADLADMTAAFRLAFGTAAVIALAALCALAPARQDQRETPS